MVNHDFMFQLSFKLNFKELFIGWIKVIYTNAMGSAINNSWMSNKSNKAGNKTRLSAFVVEVRPWKSGKIMTYYNWYYCQCSKY